METQRLSLCCNDRPSHRRWSSCVPLLGIKMEEWCSRYSPFGGGLRVTEKGKRALDGFGDISWLGNGVDALDLRLMVPASITPEVIQWFQVLIPRFANTGKGHGVNFEKN